MQRPRDLKNMNLKKTVGPDGIPIKVWKGLGPIGVTWLIELLNKICVKEERRLKHVIKYTNPRKGGDKNSK